MREEARQTAALGLVGIDREGLAISTAGMSDVISATAEAAEIPFIKQIERERHMNADGGLQATGWLPSAITNGGDVLANGARVVQWKSPTVAGDVEAGVDETFDLDLKTLEGAIHIADGSAT